MDVNLGQLSLQYLPLSELFLSAAESFIIMGGWCAEGTALLSSDRAVSRRTGRREEFKEKLFLLFI